MHSIVSVFVSICIGFVSVAICMPDGRRTVEQGRIFPKDAAESIKLTFDRNRGLFKNLIEPLLNGASHSTVCPFDGFPCRPAVCALTTNCLYTLKSICSHLRRSAGDLQENLQERPTGDLQKNYKRPASDPPVAMQARLYRIVPQALPNDSPAIVNCNWQLCESCSTVAKCVLLFSRFSRLIRLFQASLPSCDTHKCLDPSFRTPNFWTFLIFDLRTLKRPFQTFWFKEF